MADTIQVAHHGKIKIEVQLTSAEYQEWSHKLDAAYDAKDWDLVAELQESEPDNVVLDTDGNPKLRRFYVPMIDNIPAERMRKIDKSVYSKLSKDDPLSWVDFSLALLKLYMPADVADSLSTTTLVQVGRAMGMGDMDNTSEESKTGKS
jgi:hypothetical protein